MQPALQFDCVRALHDHPHLHASQHLAESLSDQAQHEMVVAEVERDKDAGDKFSKNEVYENEHKEFVGQSKSNNRAVFIIQTIMN